MNRVRIGLSKRIHAPVYYVDGISGNFPLWRRNDVKKIVATGLHLDNFAVYCYLNELPKGWYEPPFSLKGKTVLDVGACCGETAYYFLELGAKSVIAIECNKKRLALLRRNVKALKMKCHIVAEPFRAKHLLEFNHHFIKSDCEGGEINLLRLPHKLKPCVVETHNSFLTEKFKQIGFNEICRLNENQSILRNY